MAFAIWYMSSMCRSLSGELRREFCLRNPQISTLPEELPRRGATWTLRSGRTEAHAQSSREHSFWSVFVSDTTLTTATLQRLHELYPEGCFAVPRFRPNVVVNPTDGSGGFVENVWLGRIVAIGESVRLKIDLNCARCVMTTLAQRDLRKDPGILRTAAQHNQVNVGVYASVLQGGKIRRGDSIRLE
jgi:uncharacterized protein YcbX